ncbi:hypothetical protein BD413DRAFT_681550 [Trametes elegans]|nr:hypothetical protein BD413DRAFT_681550 [Trametes elegans]
MVKQEAEHHPDDSSTAMQQSGNICRSDMSGTTSAGCTLSQSELVSAPESPQPRELPDCLAKGTAIYVSSELLAAIADGQTISRTYKQDVESFGWVFIYTMYRIALNDQGYKQQKPDMYTKLNDEFTSNFSAVNIQEILDAKDHAMAETSYDEGVFPGIDRLMVYVSTRYEQSTPNTRELALEVVILVWVMLFRLRPKSRHRSAPWSRYRRIAEIENPETGLKELQPISDIPDPCGMALKPALEQLLICSGGSQIRV